MTCLCNDGLIREEKVTRVRAQMERNVRDLRQRIGQKARDFYEKRELSARDGRPLWVRARNLASLPLVLLVVAYSAFGIIFMVVPAKVVSALVRAPRRFLRHLSR